MSIKHIVLSLLFCSFYTGLSHAHQEVWKTSLPDTLEIDFAITKAFSDKLKATLTANTAPFARRLDLLRTGEIDLLCGLLKNEDREKYAYFLNPPYKLKSNKYFFVRKGEGNRLQKFEDLYRLRVGVQIGSKHFERFDNDPKIDKHLTPQYIGRFKMLISDRLDTVIHTDVYGLAILNELGLKDEIEVAPYKYTNDNPVYMAISRKSKLIERKEELEKVYRLMVESGEIDQVINTYFQGLGLPIPEYK